MNAIETHKLSKYYGKQKGIDSLNLNVEKGDFFGFIGPNGAGKSTTIRTLLGLIKPTSGSGTILGLDIVKDKKKILREVGYLPAEVQYYSGMKVKDILKYSLRLRKYKDDTHTKELCKRLDLDPQKKVDDLSLGNKKKVGIVSAIQHKPELIILDEATSGLDPLMQREFLDILEEENKRGATIFFSSHILSEIQAHCRSAAFIKNGSILVSNKLENLEEAGAKKVIITGEIDDNYLSHIEQDIKDLKKEDKYTNFLYTGDVKRLLAVLSLMKVEDIRITEPSLEELFMHYYER